MSAPVRRGTYARRCARCGWEGVYDTAKKADYAKRRHSCTKREQAMLRAAMHEMRMAAVDRTPKPCLHKIANHQHGTRAAYVLDRCRCKPCSDANAAAETERTRLKAYGRYHKYVDAYPVRLHVRELMAAGIGLKRIVKVSGVPHGVLWKLMYGKTAADGTRTPSRRVLRTTAERLYAVEPGYEHLADGAKVPIAGTRRRLQALVCLGYSQAVLAAGLGLERGNFGTLMHHQNEVTKARASQVRDLYDQLSMTPCEGTDQRSRISVSRAKNYAASQGWLPPLAWDDETIDDADTAPDVPVESGDVDEVAVHRAIAGDITSSELSKAEILEVVRLMHATALSDVEIGQRLGLTASGARKYRLELNLPAVAPASDGLWRVTDRRAKSGAA